ncbi:hypothetical protein AMATHDRAFT_65098 [Amanita thiersii Skay4041]|uniref:Uncharacterized protein n=1 Tax=Amanita thiersii Skay4041 TaxID=703135 RepID=A0A2A9NJX7_9AGAR|nr:hypothetical protein AMATHDRAFT_65098 [Amanita thiersii Skay4041]
MVDAKPFSITAPIVYGIYTENSGRVYLDSHCVPIAVNGETNWEKVVKEVQIEDIRHQINAFTLDNSGFQFFNHPTKHVSFSNDDEIRRDYYQECAEFIKEVTGAKKVVVYNHIIRRYNADRLTDVPGPIPEVHVDQTTKSSVDKLYRYFPEHEAQELSKRRFQILNLWRPVGHPLFHWPLALCDYRSIEPDKDLVTTTYSFPDHKTELFSVQYNPNHQWKYLRGMTPDDFLLFKW